ncbi:MAG TPA: hypothetical protein VJK51_02595 [Candidatus Nanoarchaeia archaeon]|nr:hypothetical protein [Candidatus Nanoarchaeia archaeon]
MKAKEVLEELVGTSQISKEDQRIVVETLEQFYNLNHTEKEEYSPAEYRLKRTEQFFRQYEKICSNKEISWKKEKIKLFVQAIQTGTYIAKRPHYIDQDQDSLTRVAARIIDTAEKRERPLEFVSNWITALSHLKEIPSEETTEQLGKYLRASSQHLTVYHSGHEYAIRLLAERGLITPFENLLFTITQDETEENTERKYNVLRKIVPEKRKKLEEKFTKMRNEPGTNQALYTLLEPLNGKESSAVITIIHKLTNHVDKEPGKRFVEITPVLEKLIKNHPNILCWIANGLGDITVYDTTYNGSSTRAYFRAIENAIERESPEEEREFNTNLIHEEFKERLSPLFKGKRERNKEDIEQRSIQMIEQLSMLSTPKKKKAKRLLNLITSTLKPVVRLQCGDHSMTTSSAVEYIVKALETNQERAEKYITFLIEGEKVLHE